MILIVGIDLIFEVDIETLKDLSILILRADDLELITDLIAKDLEGVLID